MNTFNFHIIIFLIGILLLALGYYLKKRNKTTSNFLYYTGLISFFLYFISIFEKINYKGSLTEIFIYTLGVVLVLLSFIFDYNSKKSKKLSIVLLIWNTPYLHGIIYILFFFFTGQKLYEIPDVLYSDKHKRIEIVESSPGMTMTKKILLVNKGNIFESENEIQDFNYSDLSYDIKVINKENGKLLIVGKLNDEKEINKVVE